MPVFVKTSARLQLGLSSSGSSQTNKRIRKTISNKTLSRRRVWSTMARFFFLEDTSYIVAIRLDRSSRCFDVVAS